MSVERTALYLDLDDSENLDPMEYSETESESPSTVSVRPLGLDVPLFSLPPALFIFERIDSYLDALERTDEEPTETSETDSESSSSKRWILLRDDPRFILNLPFGIELERLELSDKESLSPSAMLRRLLPLDAILFIVIVFVQACPHPIRVVKL